MDLLLAAILVGVPLAWLVGFAAYAYRDAPRHGMDPRKWAAIALVVPLFGFVAYLFEREERDYDPETDPYAGGGTTGGFAVHESRRGERPLGPSDPGPREGDDESAGTESTDGADGNRGEG